MSVLCDHKNLQNNKRSSRSNIIRTRDKKGHDQSHATLTYKVTLKGYSAAVCLFEILDPNNLQNKKKIIALSSLEPEIRKVMFKVAWPWQTRSRLKAAVLCVFF